MKQSKTQNVHKKLIERFFKHLNSNCQKLFCIGKWGPYAFTSDHFLCADQFKGIQFGYPPTNSPFLGQIFYQWKESEI